MLAGRKAYEAGNTSRNSRKFSLHWKDMESSPNATVSLTIVVHHEIEKLDTVFHAYSEIWDVVSIGREVSALLIARNEAEYSGTINQWIDECFRGSPSALFLCYDIDLLFQPTLKLDPLAIFRQISRHKKLVVLWPGSYQGNKLCYAQPEHSHYRCWKNLEGIEITGVEDAL